MTILWDSLVRPDDLTAFMRNVPLRQEYVLNQLFPVETIADEEVAIRDVTMTARTAKFRGYDAPPVPIRRDSFTRKTVKLPPLGTMLSTGEVDRRRLEIARARGGSDDAVIQAIYDDAQASAEAVLRRIELARGDLLDDGKVTIVENGLDIEADFGVPAGNIVSTGTTWSNVSADILGDLRTWSKAYRAVNGYRPGGMVLSEDLVYYMLANTAIKNLFSNSVGAPAILSMDQLAQVLRSYALPPIMMTYDAQVDVDGVTTDILPKTKVWFVPPTGTELGKTVMGMTATGQQIANTGLLSFSAASGIVGVIDRNPAPPYRETVYADAVGLPVLTNPRALYVATVIL